MREKFQLILMQNAKVLNQDMKHIQESHWEAKWVKSWASWNIPYNAFPELQTKFFHKQCVIWSFLPSFNEFHHKLHIFKIQVQFWTTNNEEKSYNKRYLH